MDVTLFLRRTAIARSNIMTAAKIPIVTSHVVVDSMAELCQLVKNPDS